MSLFGCSNGATTKNIMTDADIEKNFKMERVANGYSIKEYIGVGENVFIPKKYKGYTINKISKEAFASKEFVEKIDIPSSVEEIGERAFSRCSSLREVVLYDGTKIIGDYAFAGSGLETIKLPSSIENISDGAFSDCRSMKSLTLNEGLKKIGKYAFNYVSISEITIPRSVDSIGEHAFQGITLKKINCKLSRSYVYENKEPFSGLFYSRRNEDWEWITELDERVNFI